jgi:hypothetical protein
MPILPHLEEKKCEKDKKNVKNMERMYIMPQKMKITNDFGQI